MTIEITEDELVAGSEFLDTTTGERVHIFGVTTPEPLATIQHKTEDSIQEYRDANDLADPKDPTSGRVKTRAVPGTVTLVETVTVENLLPRLKRLTK